MGMKNTRMSRTNHPIPRMANEQYDLSGLRGVAYRDGTVLREAKDPPAAPKKHAPDPSETNYPLTPPPFPHARDGKGEGKVRGRQADKSSKHK